LRTKHLLDAVKYEQI